MRLFLQITVFSLFFNLIACTSTHTQQEASQVQPLKSIEKVVLIGDFNVKSEFSDEKVFDCLADGILDINPKLAIIKPEEFRNQLFPYFTGSTSPHTPEEYKALLNNPLVNRRIKAMGVRYLITLIESKTGTDYNGGIVCGGSYGGGGCIGLGLWDRNTRLDAQIWNLQSGNMDGNVQTQAEGTGVMPALLLPIPLYFPATEAATCQELGEKLGNILSGKT
ncbi:MAG: hypothetical protein IPN42_01030 [Methylococcaceae bacterium]|nr:hypothetical protein [Methylococcaceae bacterium]